MASLADLDTPCLIADVDTVERNLDRMQLAAKAAGVALRPHVKTHKSIAIAHEQVRRGAVGITVAKLSEADVFAAGGIEDMFIAYPLVGPASKLDRLVALAKGRRLIVGVESRLAAEALSSAALRAGTVLEVRLEIDTGLHRCGVPPEEALDLARDVAARPGLRLSGIFTFRGVEFDDAGGRSPEELGREEGVLMAGLGEELRQAGLPVEDVSVGSTPTALAAAVPGVTEIRPGMYVFNDAHLVALGVCAPEDCALAVLATVVSVGRDRATVDAGVKALSGDMPPGHGLPGFGVVRGWRHLRVARLNEEHGILQQAAPGTLPRIGERLAIVPNHVCPCVNLREEIHGIRGDAVVTTWRVDARGCSW